VHRYTFPPQDIELRGRETVYALGGDKLGSIESIALDKRHIDIKQRRDTVNVHPNAIFGHDEPVRTKVLAESLIRIAAHVADTAQRARRTCTASSRPGGGT
jgi:hypothetical protein